MVYMPSAKGPRHTDIITETCIKNHGAEGTGKRLVEDTEIHKEESFGIGPTILFQM